VLTDEDVEHYKKIVVALSETIRRAIKKALNESFIMESWELGQCPVLR
jgi:hypothetical protein